MAAYDGDEWKFKPNAEVRYEDDKSVLFFVGEFIHYLEDDGCKRKVKEHFDARYREVAGENQSMYYTQFFPCTIIKQCIMECTDRGDALCQSINFGTFPLSIEDKMRVIDQLGQRIANLLSLREHRNLYRELCSSLGINISVGFSLMSPEPYVPPPVSGAGNAEPAAPRFVPRGGGEREGINAGLKEDRQFFIDFINQQPYAWYSSISDMQENVDLPQGDMRSTKQIKELINSAHLTNLPGGSEVIIYFAGHGQEETGDWGAYTMIQGEGVLSLHVTMEDILNQWIEVEKDKDPEDYLHLTIISDCCFSNKWVERLKEDIEKGDDSKYGHYSLCIQGAASRDAYENTLLPLLQIDEVLPLCAGQDPLYIRTPAYCSPLFENRLTNRNDYEAKFNPGTVPSRRGLTKASGQALPACEGVIELWDWDCVEDKRVSKGPFVQDGKARIDFQGLSYNKHML